MASTTSVPAEPAQVKPSFAKVAASAYKPQNLKETAPHAKPPGPTSQSTAHSQTSRHTTANNGDAPKVLVEKNDERDAKANAGNTAAGAGQWATTAGQVALPQAPKEEEPEKPRASIALVKFSATEDTTTQLSSSDGSAKPPSLDGKSVASGTTFALDEKESIRPDDSASLRAVEEEDVTSPPGSVAASSRVGSDSGVARAFRDQLHEIAVMGPQPQRGIVPGRFPNPTTNGPHTLYDPNQPPNGIGRSISQPLVGGMPPIAGPHSMPASPDEKLIEALESPRDRLFVVKIEQDFIDFINNSRENELSLPNCNTFYRMLAHRLADYYGLGHVVDSTMTGVKITKTPYCRMPAPLSQMVGSTKSASTPPVDLPARKIMRRGDDAKSGTNTTVNSENPSKTTSEVGGSDGSNEGNESTSKEKDKSSLTREEREARYREARQRIFGSAENEDTESMGAAGSGEEKDPSRSSSASGKKKTKKQRSYDDDGFEARSRFNAYYPQQYPSAGFPGDGTVYYSGFPGQIPNPQFANMNPNISPPPTYNNGYPVMMAQDTQPQYGWPGQHYQPANGPMMYPNYAPAQNGYDLSTDFQRGMQSFQTAGMPTQVTPKMSNTPMASYQETYQPQPMPMNPSWPQMTQQPSYPMAQGPYAQNGPGNRPMSAPIQGLTPGSYPYGQFPSSPYNGKPNRNQHPIPGSFNGRQFNPQSQAFIPGGRNAPFQLQPNMPQGPHQGMNGFTNFQMPTASPMSSQVSRPSPPIAQTQSFSSPHIPSSNPVPIKGNSSTPSQGPHVPTSQTTATIPISQSSMPSVPAQSSIAKYGTPSHLPPKPPQPAPATSKFIAGHSYPSSLPRMPTNMVPGYMTSSPLIRGGPGTSMPNNTN